MYKPFGKTLRDKWPSQEPFGKNPSVNPSVLLAALPRTRMADTGGGGDVAEGARSPEEVAALTAWVSAAMDADEASPAALTAGATVAGTKFFIEERWVDFMDWKPCTVTSTGEGEYTFHSYEGALAGQRQYKEGQPTHDPEAARMTLEDLVLEWDTYHIPARLEHYKQVLVELGRSPTAGDDAPPKPPPKPPPPPEAVPVAVGQLVSCPLTTLPSGLVSLRCRVNIAKGKAAVADVGHEPDKSSVWDALTVYTRAVVGGKPGLVFLFGSGGEIGFCFDDVNVPWVTLTREEFVKQAEQEDVLPCGAVEYVLKGASGSAGWSCRAPSAYLRGSSLKGIDEKWAAFDTYEPLRCPEAVRATHENTYGIPPNEQKLEAAQMVKCVGPFVSASRGHNVAPTDEELEGQLLAVMLGTEFNQAKGENQVRRWCLVRFPTDKCKYDCWVTLKNVSVALGSHPINSTLLKDQVRKAVSDAAKARLPSTVHGHESHNKRRSGRSIPKAAGAYWATTQGEDKPEKKKKKTRTTETATAPLPATPQLPTGELNEIGRTEVRWGLKLVEKLSEEELLHAVHYAGLEKPPSDARDAVGWMRNAILRRSIAHHVPHYSSCAPATLTHHSFSPRTGSRTAACQDGW